MSEFLGEKPEGQELLVDPVTAKEVKELVKMAGDGVGTQLYKHSVTVTDSSYETTTILNFIYPESNHFTTVEEAFSYIENAFKSGIGIYISGYSSSKSTEVEGSVVRIDFDPYTYAFYVLYFGESLEYADISIDKSSEGLSLVDNVEKL